MKVGDNLPDPKNDTPEYLAPAITYLCTEAAKDVTGKIIGAGGGDVIIFAKPLQFPGPHQFMRKEGKWTIDELSELIPQILGLF